MYLEATQAPLAVAVQLEQNASRLRELGARLRAEPPRAVVTSARGS
jgi:glucosamine--fructose-6-phosphate aminotransferase (isomerizing)